MQSANIFESLLCKEHCSRYFRYTVSKTRKHPFVKRPLQRVEKNNEELSFVWYHDLAFSKTLWKIRITERTKSIAWDTTVVSHRVSREC